MMGPALDILAGRVLVFGNSEVRYLESLQPADRGHHAARKLAEQLEQQLQLAGMDELDESEIEEFPDTGEEP